MGCCALAPVMVVDEDIYGKVTSTKVKPILKQYKKKTEGQP
jgi:NADH:ubiquinone oxidoreductase subunit E